MDKTSGDTFANSFSDTNATEKAGSTTKRVVVCIFLASAGAAFGAFCGTSNGDVSFSASMAKEYMAKAKKYDWKDSNMALFGSDTEKKVKKESAQSEKAWVGAGEKEGVEVWRINKFKVERWPDGEKGNFFDGDSYIVLNTYKKNDGDDLVYDVHFWIGKKSTQDEYGTAAHKTVELDTYLDDKPVQHREVMGHESNLFKSYFPSINILKGGVGSGFNRVSPKKYQLRMFSVKKSDQEIPVTEIPPKRANLNSDDVFIIDNGLKVYQFNGKNARRDVKYAAAKFVSQLTNDRVGVKTSVLEEKTTSRQHPALVSLRDSQSKEKTDDKSEKSILRLSDVTGKLEVTDVMSGGALDKTKLSSDDVFFVNTGNELFVWVGKQASLEERKKSAAEARKYISTTKQMFAPITMVAEGAEPQNFKGLW